MPRLEEVIVSVVCLFEEYASKEGKKAQISIDDLKQNIEEEIENSDLKDKIHPDDIKEAMDMMDKNHDGEVNFREFSRCVAALAKGYYKQKRGKGGKRGKGKEEQEQE